MLITADVMKWLNLASRYNYKRNYYHAMLCDPPYHLTSVVERFGKGEPEHTKTYADMVGRKTPIGRLARGFMGHTWDGGQLAFTSELWAGLKEMLMPGAFCFAFAGSRGWHRMAVAIEDAGYIIHPTLFGYGFGSGFPKATRIDTQIQPKEEQEIIGRDSNKIQFENLGQAGYKDSWDVTVPTNELAQKWQSHRYGLQSLKPATEVLLMFSKPLAYEPIYSTIAETTFFVEAICLLSNVQDVETFTNQIHQHLKAVLDNSAQDGVEVWEYLRTVKFVGLDSESNLANLTLQNFAVENVLTKDAMLHLVKTILTGQIPDGLSVRDINISDQTEKQPLQNIGILWNNILTELLNLGNMSIIKMETNLITDLKILNSYLSQIILDFIIQGELTGKLSFAQIAENLLRSVLVKLPLLNSTIVQDSALGKLVSKEIDPEENQRDGLKLEPIICFQKPYEGRPIDNITRTGAGAFNIDEGRIGVDPGGIDDSRLGGNGQWNISREQSNITVSLPPGSMKSHPKGRWPSNLLLQHNPACTRKGDEWLCDETCAVRRLGEQSGWLKSGAKKMIEEKNIQDGVLNNGKGFNTSEKRIHSEKTILEASEGTAARYFYQSHFAYEIYEQLRQADPLYYTSKPGSRERNAGLDSMPDKLARGYGYTQKFNDPADGMFKDRTTQKRNFHPTLKPISLTKYLAGLLLPPDSYAPRRILVPFAGSGSEMIGAMLAGWDDITGIEMTQEYAEIAKVRFEWWQQWRRWGQTDIETILQTVTTDDNSEWQQMELF